MAEDLIFIIGEEIVDAVLAIFKLGDKTLKASFTFIYGWKAIFRKYFALFAFGAFWRLG